MQNEVTTLQNEIGLHSSYVDTASALGLASKRKIAKHRRYIRQCMDRLNEIDPVPAMTDDELFAALDAAGMGA